MRSIKLMALAGALAMTAPAVAKEAVSEWAPETFKLDNGMEVIVLPDHRAPVVTHMVWYRVGAADELPDTGAYGFLLPSRHIEGVGKETHAAFIAMFKKLILDKSG